jgi:hypothetical protein
MTKEELKQEAEKSLDKRLGTYAYIRKQDCYTNYVDGYIDSAEPREKRIAELEDKLANADYQLEGRDLEIKELEAQNDKTKNAFKKIIKTVHNDNIYGYGDRLVIIYDISCEVLQELEK